MKIIINFIMVSPEALGRVRDILFKELILPGDTGFWDVGIDNDEAMLYYDGPEQKRRVNTQGM